MHQHTEALIAELYEVARQIRVDVLDMVYRRGAGHPGGSFSAAEEGNALSGCAKRQPKHKIRRAPRQGRVFRSGLNAMPSCFHRGFFFLGFSPV